MAPGLSIFSEKYFVFATPPTSFGGSWWHLVQRKITMCRCENCKGNPVRLFLKELWPLDLALGIMCMRAYYVPFGGALFFRQCVQLLHWNFVHGFISMTYRSSSKMVTIDRLLEELCLLNFTILRGFRVFRTFIGNVCSYSIETLYMALYLCLADQVRRWSPSTDYWKSYAPWT
jgi:hypothetical protein